MDLLNKGLACLHQREGADRTSEANRTLIVSGVARSGTSMVARILCAAGIFLGDNIDEAVFEDSAIALLLERGDFDHGAMSRLVAARNAAHPVWGFKRPHLHRIGADAIRLFRNPSVILTVRDPLAIAERNAIAEQYDIAGGLSAAIDDLRDLVAFAQDLHCPTLLVSYEKAVGMPAYFVDHLLEFCGVSLSPTRRKALAQLVEPNRPAYIRAARRVFEGYIDAISGSTLTGWAWQRGLPLPVPITLLRDGVAVGNHMADRRREDLVNSAIGSGHHGFCIDLAGLGFARDSRVSVKIGGRNFVLTNSGATVAELGGTFF